MKLEQTAMFHITPKGNLAVNGGLTGDFLKNSKEDYCVEAMIRKRTQVKQFITNIT